MHITLRLLECTSSTWAFCTKRQPHFAGLCKKTLKSVLRGPLNFTSPIIWICTGAISLNTIPGGSYFSHKKKALSWTSSLGMLCLEAPGATFCIGAIWCLNVAHLEQVLRVVNDDRSICKNGSRSQDGGCNALSSLHPHDHCLLRNPIGAPCVQTSRPAREPTKNLRNPIGAPFVQTSRSAWRPTKNFGPCAEGHTTTWGGKWYRDPDDKTRQLCGKRYQQASRRRRKPGKT